MVGRVRELNQGRRPGMVEWLKAELVDSVATLFKAMLKTGDDGVSDALANIMISAYLLGRQRGIGFTQLDARVRAKLRVTQDETGTVPEGGRDLPGLLAHLEDRVR